MSDTTEYTGDDVAALDGADAQEDNGGFTTNPDRKDEDGVTYVTTEELRFLVEWNWATNGEVYRATCEACDEEMVFEKDPADFPSHPGEPGQLRVKIECPKCGHMQYTGGGTEQDFAAEQRRELEAQVRAEVAARLNGQSVQSVNGGDGGGGADDRG